MKSFWDFMTRPIEIAVFKNWKTSAIGVLYLISDLIVFCETPEIVNKPLYYQLAAWVTTGGIKSALITAGLLVAKDWNVTGK